MAKGKDARGKHILECISCVQRMLIRNQAPLKRIDTIRLVGWNYENYDPIITNIYNS